MSTVIYKYAIHPDTQSLNLPKGAEVLSVQWQHPTGLFIWAKVDPEADKEWRNIRVIATGEPLPEDVGRFVDTVQVPPLVFHIYEGGS